jgi:hypothetical protein
LALEWDPLRDMVHRRLVGAPQSGQAGKGASLRSITSAWTLPHFSSVH